MDISLNIDSSSLSNVKISDEEFVDDLQNKLQEILNHEFKDNFIKQKIKVTTTSLNFACPFCHDSAVDNKKKRAHLITSGKWAGRFKCFNCGESMTFQKFFNSFDKDLTLQDINYINTNYKFDASSAIQAGNSLTSQIINREEAKQWGIDRTFLKDTLGLQDISKEGTPIAFNYLINRCQYTMFNRYLYSQKYNQLLILNLVDDKVLGIQIRNLSNTNGPKYLTTTIEKLRALLLRDKTPVPESISKLSCIFNIFNVDFAHTMTKPILVTEGPFDAFLLPNCIALSGAAKNFAMQFPFWYVFDSDETGNKHAIEKLREGYKVFMWKKFKQDYEIPDINPYLSSGNRRKWDVSDIMKYFRDFNVEKKLLWSPYFTNNMLDALNI
jgi:predicted RNA-binding Zn-ribbon protein involved in translation (DUF1610 family)